MTDRARSSVLPLLGLVVFLALFVPALSAGIGSVAQDEGPATTVDSESITVDYDEPVRVEERGDAYDETVTVRDEDGNALEDGVDYEWNAIIGAVEFIDTASTEEGEVGEIDYVSYEAPAETDQSLAFLSPIIQMVPWLLILVGGLLAIKLVGEGWN